MAEEPQAHRVRFCWNCDHSHILLGGEPAKPCLHCSSATHLHDKPRPHASHFYCLSEADRVFLRVQGINPDA